MHALETNSERRVRFAVCGVLHSKVGFATAHESLHIILPNSCLAFEGIIGYICPMNLATAFSNSAEKCSHKTAIFWGETEHSYEQLWTESLTVANSLQNKFVVEPGDRVGLWLKNCPEFVPAVFGVFLAGGV